MSGLPGNILPLPEGAVCEDCETEGKFNVPAVKCIQGETDSFGHEEIHMCKAHYDNYKATTGKARPGRCDWCRTEVADVRPMRDLDEGMSGPVYEVCQPCRTKHMQRVQAELREYDDDDLDD